MAEPSSFVFYIFLDGRGNFVYDLGAWGFIFPKDRIVVLHKKTLWITGSLYHSARNQTQLLISEKDKIYRK